MNRLKLAGVTEDMFRQAYPNPIKKEEGVIDISDDSNDMDEAVIANMISDESEINERRLVDTSTEYPKHVVPKKEDEFEEKEIKPISLLTLKNFHKESCPGMVFRILLLALQRQ